MATYGEFEAAGLYDPRVDAESGRLDLLEWLVGLGFTIDELRWAHADPVVGLVALATDRRLLGRPMLTTAEAQLRSGLDHDDFHRLVAAAGYLPVAGAPPGDTGFTEADVETLAALGILSTRFSTDESLATLRVIVSSLGRLAEAVVLLFLQDVEAPHLRAGGDELVQAQQSYESAGLIDDGFGHHLLTLMRRHMMQAVERTRRAMIAPDERFGYRYAVGFVDMVGFTATSATMSTEELGRFVREFEARSTDTVTANGARVVKLIGDEVMFVSPDARAACRTARELMADIAALDGVQPRGGLSYGNLLQRGGDYYGTVVNLASRLVDEAESGQILATEELSGAAPTAGFEPAGQRWLKGFDQPVPVHSWRPAI